MQWLAASKPVSGRLSRSIGWPPWALWPQGLPMKSEIRWPGIKSCAQLMERKALSNEVESLAQGINVEIDRLDQIVKHLLDFAKPGEAALLPVALSEVIAETVKMVSKALDKQNVRIATEVPFSPCRSD